MKATAIIFAIIALLLLIYNQLQLNNAFEPTLNVSADTVRVFTLPPSDTVTVMLPVTNNSWHSVHVSGATATGNFETVQLPKTLLRKRSYWVIGTLITPPEPGTYRDGIVMRTNGAGTFYGSDVVYNVSVDAVVQDSIWLGYDNRIYLSEPEETIDI